MKKEFFFNGIVLLFALSVVSQVKNYEKKTLIWQKLSPQSKVFSKNQVKAESLIPNNHVLYDLNLENLRKVLQNTQNRFSKNPIATEVTVPNMKGQLERFNLYEDSNFDYELQASFPEIRAYYGIGIDDKTAQLRMSIDPSGIQTMVMRTDNKSEYIEPYSTDKKTYALFVSESNDKKSFFSCNTKHDVLNKSINTNKISKKSNKGILLNFRLALSCDGEYAKYFGATSPADEAKVIAAYNNTLSRVNGIYQTDFGIKLTLVNASRNIIFYNGTTDPYSDPNGYSSELQRTLNTRLTGTGTTLAANNNAYDVGHLFTANGRGNTDPNAYSGDAGCIACVCVNSETNIKFNTKGLGYSYSNTPTGNLFDTYLVPHEIGHQFGANHSFSFGYEPGSISQIEPGKGSTVMSYAGQGLFDVANNADPYFNAISIQQIQNQMEIKMATGGICASSVVSTTGKDVPKVNAGIDYTIPIGTPFTLTGSATNSGAGNLSYCWEQIDAIDSNNEKLIDISSTTNSYKLAGPNFRSFIPSSSPSRIFPRWSTILDNNLTTVSEAYRNSESLSLIDRILNFRLTVRDNVPNGGQTNFDDVKITVDKTKGPFIITSQNEINYSYFPGNSILVNWNVANTNLLPGGENVDIEFSIDNGKTWSLLLKDTANDGSQSVTLPAGKNSLECRFLVKASKHIFFNVSPKFAVGYNVMIEEKCTKFTNNTVSDIEDATVAFNPLTGESFLFEGEKVIRDFDVKNITGELSKISLKATITHERFKDLEITLSDPSKILPLSGQLKVSEIVSVFKNECVDTNGKATLTFSDNAENLPSNCLNFNKPINPKNSFSAFKGVNLNGTWRMLLNDEFPGSDGQFSFAELEICTRKVSTNVLSNEEYSISDLKISPLPNNGIFRINFTPLSSNVKLSIHDLSGRLIKTNNFQVNGIFNEQIVIDNASSGIYVVTLQDGIRKENRKIIVE